MKRPSLCIFILTVTLAFSFKPPLYAQGAEANPVKIAAVISREIQPYLDALYGFNEVMQKSRFKIQQTRYNLIDITQKGGNITEEIRRAKPDLILTIGTEATKTVSGQISDLPIVFSMVLDTSLAQNKANLTGASMLVPIESQLKELSEIMPQVKKIGILCSQAYYLQYIAKYEQVVSEQMKVKFLVKFANNETEFLETVGALLSEIDAFLFVPDEAILSPRTSLYIILEALRYNKPVIAPSLKFVEDGALLALGNDYRDIGRQSAELATLLLEGKNPSDLPVTKARATYLYLNLRTAKQIGISIPQKAISRAAKVFE